jgi:hypothetical protein
MEIWLQLVQSIATYLPDLDMAMDSSRVFAQWEVVQVAIESTHHMGSARRSDPHYTNNTQTVVTAEWTRQRKSCSDIWHNWVVLLTRQLAIARL